MKRNVLAAISFSFLTLVAGRGVATADPVCQPCVSGANKPGWTHGDVGSVGGCASYDATANTYTVIGSGTGITGNSDSFHYAYTAVSGNFALVAKVSSQGTAGLMLRELENNAASRHGFSFRALPAGPYVETRWREYNAERTHAFPIFPPAGVGQWQKLVRSADRVSFYNSMDGIEWRWVWGLTLRDLGPTVYAGFAVEQCSSVGIFESVQLTVPFTPTHPTSWIGNSLPGGIAHIQQDILGMHFDPGPNMNPLTGLTESAGRLYALTYWDEGGAELVSYTTDGAFERNFDNIHDGIAGGYAVTSNANYVYAAVKLNMDTEGCDPGDYAVRRYNKNGTMAPWTSGENGAILCRSFEEIVQSGGSMLKISSAGHVRGVAINRRVGSSYSNRLYVSNTAANKVQMFLATDATLSLIGDVSVSRPRAIAIDPGNDTFWVIRADDPATGTNESAILHFTAAGAPLSGDTISSGSNFQVPVALTVGTDHRVYVTDDGPSQLVKIFKANGTPANPASFGAVGGITSTAGGSMPGEVRPTKFNGLTGIGLDLANGFIYLAGDGPDTASLGLDGQREHGTGTDLRKLSYPSGTLAWQKLGLEFIDGGDVDPETNGNDVFTKEEHFVMDYSQPAGQQATYKGMTIDRWTYPNDMRLHNLQAGGAGVYVRRIGPGGPRILYVIGMNGEFVGVYRFGTNSEVAVPCGLLMARRKVGHCSNNLAVTCFNDYWCGPNPPSTGTCGLPDYCSNNPTTACNVNATCGGGTCVSTWPPLPISSGFDYAQRYIWHDVNGDGQMEVGTDAEFEADSPYYTDTYGWYVDDDGDIWAAGEKDPFIRRYPAQLDSHGCPAYDPSNATTYSKPAEFGPPESTDTFVERALYIPATDTMLLGGYTTGHPKPAGGYEFGMVGTEIVRYDNWQANHDSSHAQEAVWTIPDLPYGYAPYHFHAAKGMDVAGENLFVSIADTGEVRAYDLGCGTLRDSVIPGPEVAGKTGLLDSVVSMNAFERSNGETVVFVEDDAEAKLMSYRFTVPTPTCGATSPPFYCTGVEEGCALTDPSASSCGCCDYTCGQYIDLCAGPQSPPPSACP